VNVIPFDVTQRYRAVGSRIGPWLEGRRGVVLDVGGSRGPGSGWLPDDARRVVVDVAGKPGVRGNGARLPFRDDCFDASISCDVLEHVPGKDRGAVLAEMMRVTRGPVVVAAPFDTPGVKHAEEVVDALVRDRLGRSHPALEEHRAEGLPDLDATCEVFRSAGREVRVGPNGALQVWLPFMLADWYLADHSALAPLREELARYYGEDVAGRDDHEPAYRHVVEAWPAGNAPAHSVAPALDSIDDTGGSDIDFEPVRALVELFMADGLRASESARMDAEERMRGFEARAESAEEALRIRDAHIRDLERSIGLHAEELGRLRAFRRRFTHSPPARVLRAMGIRGRSER